MCGGGFEDSPLSTIIRVVIDSPTPLTDGLALLLFILNWNYVCRTIACSGGQGSTG